MKRKKNRNTTEKKCKREEGRGQREGEIEKRGEGDKAKTKEKKNACGRISEPETTRRNLAPDPEQSANYRAWEVTSPYLFSSTVTDWELAVKRRTQIPPETFQLFKASE